MTKRVIALDKDLYPVKVIDSTIDEYAALASIKKREINGHIYCLFTSCKYDTAQTIKEFCNYLIDSMNSKE